MQYSATCRCVTLLLALGMLFGGYAQESKVNFYDANGQKKATLGWDETAGTVVEDKTSTDLQGGKLIINPAGEATGAGDIELVPGSVLDEGFPVPASVVVGTEEDRNAFVAHGGVDIGGALKLTGAATGGNSMEIELGEPIDAALSEAQAAGDIAFSPSLGQIALTSRTFSPSAGGESSTKMAISSQAVEITSVQSGTPDPEGASLKVDGTIEAKTIKIGDWEIEQLTDAGAPDYVFEEDYDLRELDEVESYIQENKHLPDVPSGKEFEEKGANLIEMNYTLLRKVEELTLYVIEQQKQIEELRERVGEGQ